MVYTILGKGLAVCIKIKYIDLPLSNSILRILLKINENICSQKTYIETFIAGIPWWSSG